MAVLQLVKDTPKRRANRRRGAYKPHMVVAVYEDSEITEPPSPNSNLYFVRVPGSKADYEYLLEQLDKKDASLGRMKYTLDFQKLRAGDRSDIQDHGDLQVQEDRETFKAKFKETKPIESPERGGR